MEAARIWVDPLGEPSTPPDELAGGRDAAWEEDLREDLEPGEDWTAWATERMIPAAQAAYRVAGVASAIALRVPIDRAWELWATEPDEVRPVVAAILPMVPRTPLAGFVIGRLPAAAAIVQGAGLAIDRVRATRALRTEEPADARPDRPAARAPERPTVLGVGSIPFAESGGDRGRPGRVPDESDDERSMDVARPGGNAPDGTISDPAQLRRLMGNYAPTG
jgi:hypothetical protein